MHSILLNELGKVVWNNMKTLLSASLGLPWHAEKQPHLYGAHWRGVVVAEWLRRWTRNPLGSSRAGSNPADNVPFAEQIQGILIVLLWRNCVKHGESENFSPRSGMTLYSNVNCAREKLKLPCTQTDCVRCEARPSSHVKTVKESSHFARYISSVMLFDFHWRPPSINRLWICFALVSFLLVWNMHPVLTGTI